MICFNDAELNAHYSKEEKMDRRFDLAKELLDGEALHNYCDNLVEYCQDYENGKMTLEELGIELLRARNSAIEDQVEKMQ